MQVGQRETNGLDAILENVFLDWPSLMSRGKHLRQAERFNATDSVLYGSEQECHRCQNRPKTTHKSDQKQFTNK